mgnify:CR=1 FL=1
MVLRPAAEGIYQLVEIHRTAYGVFQLDRLSFAVASIRGWWRRHGRRAYPHAGRLLLAADAGFGSGSRCSHLLRELQRLSNDLRLRIEVAQYPAGTCRWDAAVQRLFLLESVLLAMAGGSLGLTAGFGIAALVRTAVPGMPLSTPPEAVAAALVMSFAVGIGSGVAPARRAANLDPIEALRAE